MTTKREGHTSSVLAALAAGAAVAWVCGSPVAQADSSDPSLAGEDLLSSIVSYIDGVSPDPSMPGIEAMFSGSSSLANSLLVSAVDSLEPLERSLGVSFPAELVQLVSTASPPTWLESLAGLDVTETEYDGMPVYELSAADPSGDYVVAVHGGAFIDQPSLINWMAYTDMAEKTYATIVVPIYPLATEGGTAGTVDPEIASLISSEIAAHGADNVSVYGDSAGGSIALSAVEMLAAEGKTVPESMVLDSPALDLSLSNPNIAFVNDPLLGTAGILQDDELWAGNLPLTDPVVSPLYGSLEGLPPTYVYAGSDDLLAPDVLRLQQEAIAQDAPFSFILRNGELHDWALMPFGDGGQVQDRIYAELGLTTANSSAAIGNSDLIGDLSSGLHDISIDLAHGLTATAGEMTTLSGDLTVLVVDIFNAL